MIAARGAGGVRDGGSWGRGRHGAAVACLGLALALSASATVVVTTASAAAGPLEPVIVRALPGAGLAAAEQAARDLGGRVGLQLPIVDGFAARLPRAGIAALRALHGIVSVEADAPVRLSASGGFDAATDAGSLVTTTLGTGAQAFWRSGYTGRGVDVALIDSGVTRVDGLSAAGKVVNGPDLTQDADSPALRSADGFGHGTHMAGIIAGRDAAAVAGAYAGNSVDFVGMAPDARLVSVKVADAQGNSDVSQVIAGIGWVVEHRTDNGLNIRILNLSFGTNSTQAYALDPLAHAAEVAWRHGLVVVASAGNFGNASDGLADPAADPYVIAAGAVDTMSTLTPADDTVAAFSNGGTSVRTPDLVAPGTHIASLRDPGSTIDMLNGLTATVAGRFFRGSGTSQAAAVVSGAAALLLSQRPSATPDQVKALLTGGAAPLGGTSRLLQGAGQLRLQPLLTAPTPAAHQTWPVSTGAGSLERSRGGWSGGGWSGGGWSGGGWSGVGWFGGGWSADVWA
ncbi:MAG: serine protease AprX [Chloroflexota bacterium]|nr:serine protease AprX [Chloroflexota bacterium]